jgi:hypothetical protein
MDCVIKILEVSEEILGIEGWKAFYGSSSLKSNFSGFWDLILKKGQQSSRYRLWNSNIRDDTGRNYLLPVVVITQSWLIF